MPRVGSRPEELSKGGSQFEFQPGRGKIISAVVAVEPIPGKTALCGYKVTIQRLGPDWKALNAEPQEEFLMAGWVSTPDGDPAMHPGKAKSSDDDDPELEIGGKLDMGGGDDAVGNCLLTASHGPKEDSELGEFSLSAIHHGVKKDLFNGYAPNLVGLEAEFTRKMGEKRANSDPKKPAPTALIIGRAGKVEGAETKELIHKYPDAMTGASTTKKGPVGPVPVGTKPKVNGAPVATATGEEATAEEAAAGISTDTNDDVETVALNCLVAIGEAAKTEQKVTKQKLGARVIPILARMSPKVPTAINAGVQAQFKKDEWLIESVTALGWTVDGTNITIPAAE